MEIDHKGLQYVSEQLFVLSEKTPWSKEDRQRSSNLIALRASIQAGAQLQDLLKNDLNERERANGLPVTRFPKPEVRNEDAREKRARVWSHFCRTGSLPPDVEHRDTGVGHGVPEYLPGSQGSFVPRTFFDNVREQLKYFDPLMSAAVCTHITTTHGRPMQIGSWDDTAQMARMIPENSNQSANESDLTNPTEIDVSAYSYRTQPFRASIEALTDVDEMITLIDMFTKFTASRIARGVGYDMTVGQNVPGILGLVPSLQIAGNAQAAVLQGASETTGNGLLNGTNSIGVTDVANLYYAVNQASRMQPKTAWLMNDNTRSYLSRLLDKQGHPVFGDMYQGRDVLFGKPVYTSPSIANIASGTIPIVFGDLSAWYVRCAIGGERVQLLKETYADKGQIGLRSYARYDGVLIQSASQSGTPSIMYSVCHS